MTDSSQEPFRFRRKVPEGEDRERLVCDDCGFIHYINPKIVVGSVATWADRILLCKRAIEPRRGYWTLPAGFLEEEETTEQGAVREAQEEANARIKIDALLAIYNVPRISQVQLFYTARLMDADVKPGIESEEAQLFAWDEIPWSELSFPTVHWALQHHKKVQGLDAFPPFTNPD